MYISIYMYVYKRVKGGGVMSLMGKVAWVKAAWGKVTWG